MSFFKRLFSPGKKEAAPAEKAAFNMLYTDEYFNKRYSPQDINTPPEMLDACLKMVQSYFADNNIPMNTALPVNHPENLDKTVTEGTGFTLYCRAFGTDDAQITLFLAYAFAAYLINRYGFNLYKDSEPEYPLRGMTVKYDKDGVVMSLYPFEYAHKVLNNEATFAGLYERINAQIKALPTKEEVLKSFLPEQE